MTLWSAAIIEASRRSHTATCIGSDPMYSRPVFAKQTKRVNPEGS